MDVWKSLSYHGPGSVLLAIALTLRVGATLIWWADTQTDPDAYVGLARELATGSGFCTPGTDQPTAYRPPVYPLFLSTLLTVDGFQNGLAIPVWNILFDLATLGFVWSWLRYSSSNWIAPGLAVLLLAVDPLMVRYTPLAMTEACFTCWTTAGVLLLANIAGPHHAPSDRLERGLWGVAGGLLGVAALCRPSIWPFLAALVFICLIRGCVATPPALRRTRFAELATFLAALVMLTAPWVIRNAVQFRQPILTTTHGGYTLLLANNPVFYDEVARQPWGTVWSGDSLDRWQRQMFEQMEKDLGAPLTEVEQDRWQTQQAWRSIAADPAGFCAGMWYRIRSFWSLTPRGPGARSLPFVVVWLVGIWYGLFFAAAAWGAWLMWRRRASGLWVLLLFMVSLQIVHLVYWTDTRMRLPLHPLLAILAVQPISQLLQNRLRERAR